MNSFDHPAWQDDEHETRLLIDVRRNGANYDVELDSGWHTSLNDEHLNGLTPQLGDALTLWGRGIGYPFRGQALRGHVLWYRTEEEERARHETWAAEREATQIAEYEATRDEREATLAALPETFRERIIWFRNGVENWGPRYEPYELFVCTEAVKFAAAFPSPEQLQAFKDMSWDDQKAALPTLDDGHSGNTFGAACWLAALYLEKPDALWMAHGALCPLVGCERYGCYAARHAEVA